LTQSKVEEALSFKALKQNEKTDKSGGKWRLGGKRTPDGQNSKLDVLYSKLRSLSEAGFEWKGGKWVKRQERGKKRLGTQGVKREKLARTITSALKKKTTWRSLLSAGLIQGSSQLKKREK